MRPKITAFAASPDRGRGLARDMRVRWALEEVGNQGTRQELRLVGSGSSSMAADSREPVADSEFGLLLVTLPLNG